MCGCYCLLTSGRMKDGNDFIKMNGGAGVRAIIIV